ncbi:glycosyltransferase family 61 protein [Fictibacillus phosphorivorans]|uniref:glycosyltransferase family 61 protein n=1 Tax=Fictibacillus phosphorivorans TaxID=1221500 RepID=UPI00204213E1|nr:glycosyltransferase family 61 protein [Fictibacillus phosphorivorans]MCM3719145.1 glycosyltransferase family 61 protein [Fictibacillus phosphorivorans]MCM3776767.1 glycosyltransferase family 61 protein [Fictibacillus phosphorivorans]
MEKKYYAKTKEWLDEVTPQTNINQVYQEFYTNQIVRFKPPKGDPPQWVDWVKPLTYNIDQKFDNAYVATVYNGSVWFDWTRNGRVYVMTPTLKLLRDMTFHLLWPYFNQERIPTATYTHETVAVIAWAGHKNYWHWLHDNLARFHLLELSGIKINKYLLPPIRYPYQWQTLQMLGIPRDKIIQLRPNMHLRAKKLVLPSVPFTIDTSVKWSIDYLRNSLLNENTVKNSDEYEKIYISRDDASWRKVINEERVIQILEKRGFKKVVLKNKSVQEQINIFNSAKYIIGTNGAGMSNIMFCKPGTKIIQLFTTTSDEFIKISNYLDLDFSFFKCNLAPPISRIHPVLNNMTIDINKLIHTLDLLGIN